MDVAAPPPHLALTGEPRSSKGARRTSSQEVDHMPSPVSSSAIHS
jgi:hypothetical protein